MSILLFVKLNTHTHIQSLENTEKHKNKIKQNHWESHHPELHSIAFWCIFFFFSLHLFYSKPTNWLRIQLKPLLHCNPLQKKKPQRKLSFTHQALPLDPKKDAISSNKHILSTFCVLSTGSCAGNRDKPLSASTVTLGRQRSKWTT